MENYDLEIERHYHPENFLWFNDDEGEEIISLVDTYEENN
jgi:aminoglycoside/choline kinase family phosphotransferase